MVAVLRFRGHTSQDSASPRLEGSLHVERVLEGIKVLEVSAWAFVPSAGAVLADWGADVIQVEPPEGDPMRGPVSSGIAGGVSFPWEMWNRGKRSIAVDLNNDEGRELVLQLAEQADVFL